MAKSMIMGSFWSRNKCESDFCRYKSIGFHTTFVDTKA